jgi:hypothetical protein
MRTVGLALGAGELIWARGQQTMWLAYHIDLADMRLSWFAWKPHGWPDCPARRAASPVISSIPAQLLRIEGGQRQRRLHMSRCARDVFQLAGTNSLGVIAPPSSKVLDSLESEGETRQWILMHRCVRERVAVEDDMSRHESVTERG